MVDAIQHLVRAADSVIARAYLAMFRERNSLMSFLFHSLFRDEREIARNDVDPLERTTVAKFRQLIEYYLEHGYRFICPDDLIAGLPADGKYALLTFDDGYFNNTLARPVLQEFNVPATFFVSTNHVLQNKCFWWDALYRERIAQGAAPRSVYHEAIDLKSKGTEQIEQELLARFGPDALKPRSDIDRPFTPEELREFAADPLVHLGNHTANHAILTNYDGGQVRQLIRDAQTSLREMTGKVPIAIAYPNGAHNDDIVKASVESGLKVGFTVRPEKHSLPLTADTPDLMRLGRFCPHNDHSMVNQCRTYRSDVLIYGALRGGYLRWVRKQVAQ